MLAKMLKLVFFLMLILSICIVKPNSLLIAQGVGESESGGACSVGNEAGGSGHGAGGGGACGPGESAGSNSTGGRGGGEGVAGKPGGEGGGQGGFGGYSLGVTEKHGFGRASHNGGFEKGYSLGVAEKFSRDHESTRDSQKIKEWFKKTTLKQVTKFVIQKVAPKAAYTLGPQVGFVIDISWPEHISKLQDLIDFDKLNSIYDTLPPREMQEIEALWGKARDGDEEAAKEMTERINKYQMPHISNIERQEYRKKSQDCAVISPSIHRRTSPRN